MAKRSDDFFMDAMLDSIATCTNMNVCSAEPANFAAIAGVSLASTTLTAGDGNGDYTVLNGDVSGRKLSVLIQANVSISTSGTANHVVLDDGTNLYITTCTGQVLTSGGTVTIPEYDAEVADPV